MSRSNSVVGAPRSLSRIQEPMIDEKKTAVASNVNAECTEEEIRDFFGYCGTIKMVNLVADPENPGGRKAVLVFDSEEAMQMSLLLSGADLKGSEITVSISQVDLDGYSLSEFGQTFMGKQGSPTTAPRLSGSRRRRKKKVSGSQTSIEQSLSNFKEVFQKLDPQYKVATAGGVCLALGATIAMGKHFYQQQNRNQEKQTRSLIAAYDHLFND
eukprot:TRINITY_DN17053_c0_g1_i1.p1 TRINITY_DN17053_c0_g1~~TRINITY_DN17053_c0_g1_i1.p1  ORF type:complete len:213 (+),score=40.01 TRINITY_DN17053_c0_g1_i1:67-705(+)